MQMNEKTGLLDGRSSVSARNVGGAAIPEGQEDLPLWFYFDAGLITTDGEGPMIGSKDRDRPALKKDQAFTRESHLGGRSPDDQLRLVLAAGTFPR